MPYESEMAELARCAVGHHGELKEVVFIDGNKDYELVFADGTTLRPSNEESLRREYGGYPGYMAIAGRLGGTHPYSLLTFGYQGTGPACMTTFLKTCGFAVSESQIVDLSPPARLRKDGFVTTEPPAAGEHAAAPEPMVVEEPVPAVVAEPVVAAEDHAAAAPAPEPVAPAEPVPPASPPADWYADPRGRHQYRYWDGEAWTDHVADNGVAAIDPLNPPPKPKGPIEFDESGHVANITLPKRAWWDHSNSATCQYYTAKADTLLEATEYLREVTSIPRVTYYVVETPDGNLGRDMNGFYTEGPIHTKNLRLLTTEPIPAPVEFEGLTVFGDPMVNQSTVANLKAQGQYAKFILEMECGACGYKSPVETEGGSLERQCYCCGATNTGMRGMVMVIGPAGEVAI